MQKTILITGILSSAEALSRHLSENQFSVILEPIFFVKKIFQEKKIADKNIQAVVLTSINATSSAIDFLQKNKISKKVKIFITGKSTAKSMLLAGYKNLFYPKNTENPALQLKKIILKNTKQSDGKIIYFCGNFITLDFKQELDSLGFETEKFISYKIKFNENFSDEFLKKTSKTKIDYILFFSSKSVEKFFYIARSHNLLEYFANSKLLCFSKKILEQAKKINSKNAHRFNKIKILQQFYE
jgi:uroporphyrinogen-III synthase